MKKIIVATVLAGGLLGSASAFAADLAIAKAVPAKAPPMVASPVYDWSGFYAGLHVGHDWGRAHVIDNGVLTEDAVPMNGVIGGALAGINWQAGAFVYGLEGDFGITALRGSGAPPPPPPGPAPAPGPVTGPGPAPAPPPAAVAPPPPNQYKVDVNGHIRARVGVAVLPTTLVYAAGGLALSDFEFRDHGGPTAVSRVLVGWTIGGGIEQAFTKNLIGRVEYLYADYGHKDFTVAPGDIYTIGFKSQTVRGALMWKF